MDKVKKTVYLTQENKEMLRKASFLSYKSQTEILNVVLESGLKKYLDKLETKEQNENEKKKD